MNVQLASVVVVACLGGPAADGPRAPTPEESKPAKIELRTTEVTVPLHWFLKKPVVDLRINGKGPYRFFLDTGAQGSVLDQGLADELKLPVVGKARVGSPGGQGLPAKQVRLDRLEVGDAVLSTVPAVAFDRAHLYAAKDAPRGVLSAGIFPGFLVTLDYPRSKLVIRRGQLPLPDGASVFAYDARRPLPEIRLSVAGQEVNLHLDSGAPGGITLPLKMAEHLPLASRPVEVARGKFVDREVILLGAKLNGSVKLGRYVVENPELRFQDIPDAPGHVGYEFLRRFAVTVDAANHRLQLEEKPAAPKAPDKPEGEHVRLPRRGDQETAESRPLPRPGQYPCPRSIHTQFTLGMGLLLLVPLGDPAGERRETAPDDLDPKVVALVKQVGAVYKDAKSLHVEATLAATMREGDEKRETTIAVTFDLEKPNRFALRSRYANDKNAGLEVFCDGKTLSMHGRRLKQYTQAAAPDNLAGIGAQLLSFGPVPTGMLFQNLLTDDPGAALLDGVTACSDAGTERVADTITRHLKFKQPEFNWELWVAAEGKPLVLRMRSERTTDAGALVTVETYKAWKLDQTPAKDTFAFVAPPDAKKVPMFTTGK